MADQALRPMLEHALEYLSFGYPVFPVCSPRMGSHEHWSAQHRRMMACDSPGKRPLDPWEPFQSRQPTENEVRAWWARYPKANIGMATGALSGVVVLDCDGTEARTLAMEKGGLDRTPAVWTGKIGGVHYWLEHPGEEVRNFVAGRRRRLPGLDFRGDGGYVLLPPSIHATGKDYRWNEHTIGMRSAPIPDWLWELLREGRSSDDDAEIGDALDVEAMLGGFDEGGRDDGLFRLACRFRYDNQAQAYAEALIRVAARNCRPAFDEELAVEKVQRAYREYEPHVDYDSWIDELADGPLRVGGTETAPLPDSILGDEADDPPVGWRVYNAEDFLAIEYPPIEWRIEGYLREKAILFSFGPPGSIKTYVATDAALAIASGESFLNRFSCQQGVVLVVQEDTLGSDYQQAYLRPMMAARGITGADVRDTLFIAPPADFAFDQAERLKDLCEWLKEYTPDLLVIDSFYLMYSGKKEDLIEVMKLLKRIRNRFGCAIWIIDHNRKSQGAGSVGEDAIDRLINGREKSAAVDVVMESRTVKGESGSVFLDVLKQRGVKLPEPLRVTYADGRLTVDGDAPESPKGSAQVVYEWLCREGGSRTKDQIARGGDLSARSVNYAMGELAMGGLVRKSGKQGRSALWIAIRKADAEPVMAPDFELGDENDD